MRRGKGGGRGEMMDSYQKENSCFAFLEEAGK